MWRAWVCVVLIGCADDGRPNACPGTPPASRDDCFSGRFFAECGGTGEPVFACNSDDCRWFVAGCTPAGYVRSSCPSDDPCCYDNGTPFSSSQLDSVPESSLWWMFYGNGVQPWNRQLHEVIPVAVDSTLAPTTTDLSCVGFSTRSGICDAVVVQAAAGDLLTLRIQASGEFYRTLNLIEIERSAPSLARACTIPSTDDVQPEVCYAPIPVDCAVSGSIVVNSLDDAGNLAGSLDLTFGSGATITGTFSVD